MNEKEEKKPLLEEYTTNNKNSENKINESNKEDKTIGSIFFRPIQHGSLKSSISCMLCVTLGTGMLPIPYMLISNGIILSLIFFIVFSIPTFFSLQFLISISNENEIYSYPGIIEKKFGKKSFMVILTIISLLINSFGSIILWDFYIKEFSLGVLNYIPNKFNKEVANFLVCLVILFIIQIPLAIYNKGNEFDLMSMIGILQILYVIILLIIQLPYYFKNEFEVKVFKNIKIYFNFNPLKLLEIPFELFISFGNHSTILSVIEQIKDKETDRVLKVGKFTFFFEFFLYLLITILCLFSTDKNTNPIFLIREEPSFLLILGQFFMIILMVCNISLYYFTTMPTLEFIFNQSIEFTKKQNLFISIFLLTTLMGISLFIDSLDKILSFLGIFAQVSLIFILPISLYIKINQEHLKLTHKIMLNSLIIIFSLFAIIGFICIYFVN